MLLVSSITACKPFVPISAAEALTLRSPRSVMLAVQTAKLPDSNPSAKIKSDEAGVFVKIGVNVAVGGGPLVEVAVAVDVFVAVGVFVGVLVGVPDVLIGVTVGIGPAANKLNASTSLAAKPHVPPSK